MSPTHRKVSFWASLALVGAVWAGSSGWSGGGSTGSGISTATAPLIISGKNIYLDGGTGTSTCSGANVSGLLCNSGGVLAVDAGFVVVGALGVSAPIAMITSLAIPPALGQMISFGGNNAAASQMWGPVATPSTSNYVLQMSPNGVYLNSVASVNISISDGAARVTCESDGCVLPAAANKGVLTLGGGGTATATVKTGAVCSCSYATTGVVILVCNVSTNTLTATGTIGSTVSYTCI